MIPASVRLVAAVLSPYMTGNVYTLLTATDEVLTALKDAGFLIPETPDYSTHQGRVQAALNSVVVMDYVRDDKKIHAIKELRTLTSCGLKEAKDAVEATEVWDVSPQAIARREREAVEQRDREIAELQNRLNSNPWDDDYDPDEPPF